MTTPMTTLPDVESALMFLLVPQFPSYRFVTSMPAGDPTKITVRITRVSGAPQGFWVDQPTVDIDVWGFRSDTMSVSIAARDIQAFLLAQLGVSVTNGVIQRIVTISGPRQLPEVNQKLARYNASYEVRIHP